jgi:hypothetical protein
MKIQPISTFSNGETTELTNFVLKSIGDNMALEPTKGLATLYYELQSVAVNEDGSETYTNVITATLEISGADYDSWNNDPTSNAWAYNWAAGKLNLVLIP